MKINLLIFALIVSIGQAVNDVNIHANPLVDAAALKQKSAQVEHELFAKSIPGVDVALKKKPSGKLTSLKTDEKGKADFGVLPAGEYVLTLGISPPKRPDDTPQLTVSFSSTKSNIKNNPTRVRIEGTAAGVIDKVYAPNQVWAANPDEMNATKVGAEAAGIHFQADGKQKVVVTVLAREQQGPAN